MEAIQLQTRSGPAPAPVKPRRGTRRKVLLIEPYPPDNIYRLEEGERRALWFPKLSLPVLAAHTPPHWEVEFVDESVRPVDFNAEADFVGVSAAMTCYAPRAYEIARRFRARGIPTAIGGTHPSFMPEEAAQHVDTVVIGEAEALWPQVLADAEEGKLQKFYRMNSFPVLENYPAPRIEIFPQDAYMTPQCLFTTRGCHFDCEFCSVSPFNGKTSRRRPVNEVVAEIQRIKEWRRSALIDRMARGKLGDRLRVTLRFFLGIEDGTIFAFVDDLHNSSRTYCKELWSALKELNIKWGAQCTLFLGDEPEMVKLAAESGCVSMFVGMESIFEEVMDETNKPFNRVTQYEKQIKTFHDHGVMLNTGIIFGFDNDDESAFQRTVEFLVKTRVELAYFNVLTPLPGTHLFERMKAEGRIFDWNWEHYDGKHVVYYPKRMSPEALQEGFFWANQQFYGMRSILTRVAATSQRLVPRWEMNRQFRHLIRRTTPEGKISPLGRALYRMHTAIPNVETDNFIPNALLAIKQTVGSVSQQIDRFLHVKARRAEAPAEAPPETHQIVVELKGTLDRASAGELKRRLLSLAQRLRVQIVVNFEHLAHTTPAALQTLLDREVGTARIRYANLKKSFQTAMDVLTGSGFQIAEEMIS